MDFRQKDSRYEKPEIKAVVKVELSYFLKRAKISFLFTSSKCMRLWQHPCLKPPTVTEALWPSRTTALCWLRGWNQPCGGSVAVCMCVCVCVCLCVCVCEDVQMWVIIVIWADCRSHALLLSLHTHYICGHTTLLQCLITETTARDFNVTSATAAPRTYVCLSVFVIMHHFERVQPHWWLRACRQRSGSWLGTHMMRD